MQLFESFVAGFLFLTQDFYPVEIVSKRQKSFLGKAVSQGNSLHWKGLPKESQYFIPSFPGPSSQDLQISFSSLKNPSLQTLHFVISDYDDTSQFAAILTHYYFYGSAGLSTKIKRLVSHDVQPSN